MPTPTFAWVHSAFSTGHTAPDVPFSCVGGPLCCVVVIAFGALPTDGIISDTASNVYVQLVEPVDTSIHIFYCINPAAGSFTVSTTSGTCLLVLEYSSTATGFSMGCGACQTGGVGTVASNPFSSAREVMAIMCGWTGSNGVPIYFGSGDLRMQATTLGGFADNSASCADLYMTSVDTAWSTAAIRGPGEGISTSLAGFLYFAGDSLPAHRPRGNIDMDQIRPRVLRGKLTGDFLATHKGQYTENNIPKWDGNGNLIDSGISVTGSGTGIVTSVFGRIGDILPVSGDYDVTEVTGAAPLASPAFTGVPTAPTAAPGTNTTQIATTAFVLANAGSGLVKYETTFTATTSLTVTHSLGTKGVIVQVYDPSDQLFEPESVTTTSTSVVTITFGSSWPSTGTARVVIIG